VIVPAEPTRFDRVLGCPITARLDQLGAYALDIAVRVNWEGAYFLRITTARNVMPHNNREELIETLLPEL
jgi:hypothetical protein